LSSIPKETLADRHAWLWLVDEVSAVDGEIQVQVLLPRLVTKLIEHVSKRSGGLVTLGSRHQLGLSL
jgi:hypothetical protein